jgi:tRNA pseudouridine38-40 synthase
VFKYRLDIAYDGKEFSGSQVQPNRRTVEGELSKQLSRLCILDDLTFSGRTDAGVHARQQVISFISTISDEEKFKKSLTQMLPEDINLRSFKKTSKNFDARYSAKSRTYYYFIKNINKSIPTDRHATLLIDEEIDLVRLNKITQYLIGKNDFLNYSKENKRKNTVRNITRANWKETNNLYRFSISGESFLWQMVRSIVGSLLALNNNKIEEKDIKNYLNQKDLGRIPYIAPPEGLHLWKIEY